MKITVVDENDAVFNLELDGSISIEDVQNLCASETGIAPADIKLEWNGENLTDGEKTLSQYGIEEGEILYVNKAASSENQADLETSIQKRIEEEIRLKNVQANEELAFQYAPELFTQPDHCYINCVIDGVLSVNAMVDSGAFNNILTKRIAEKCGNFRKDCSFLYCQTKHVRLLQ